MRIHQKLNQICSLLIASAFVLFANLAIAEDAAVKKSNSDWPSFRNNDQLQGVAGSSLPEKLEELWVLKTENGIASTAAIVDGKVFIGTIDGTVLCLDLKTGDNIWTYTSVENPKKDEFLPGFRSSAAVSKDSVMIGDEEGMFHCIDRSNGKLKWKFETGSEINSSPTITGDNVIFGSNDNSLYCLNVKTGKKVWDFQTEGYVNCAPAIAGNLTFVTGCDEHLRVIDINTGKQTAVMPLQTYLIASPALVGDMLYVGTQSSEVLSINWKTMLKGWTYKDDTRNFPYHSSAAVTEKFVILGGQDKQLHCIDRKTGENIWKARVRSEVNSSPVIVDERIFVGCNDGFLYEFAIADGKQLNKFQVGRPVTASPAVGNGCLVIGSDSANGKLICYGKKE